MSTRRTDSARRIAEPKPIPSNVDAERSVLGSLIIENAGFELISSQLEPKDFYNVYHGKIYEVMRGLFEQGIPVDFVSIKDAFDKLPDKLNGETALDDVGGPAYIASLTDGVPRSTNVRYYANIVRSKAALRKLAVIGHWMVEAAHDQQLEPHQIVNEADLKLTSMAIASKLSTGAVALGDAVSAFDADLAQRVERTGKVSGFPTGFPKRGDLYTHGWQRGEMVVFAGQTSFGKSILAQNTALSIALAGGRVVYYSYEMPMLALQRRLVAQLTAMAHDQDAEQYAAVPLSQILWGNIKTDREWAAIRWARQMFETLPLEINATGSRSVADIRSECRQIKAERGLAAIVIDHFQLTDAMEGDNRVQQLANNSRRIQELTMELDIVSFTLSQLTLTADEARKEPQLEHLRDCKSLAHDAGLVLMIHPEKVEEARDPDVPVMRSKLLIRKNRGEQLGVIWANLEKHQQRFVECDPPEKGETPAKEARPVKKFWEKKKTH